MTLSCMINNFTQQAMQSLVHVLSKKLQKHYTRGKCGKCYFDIKKAFDTISHLILLDKLYEIEKG